MPHEARASCGRLQDVVYRVAGRQAAELGARLREALDSPARDSPALGQR